MKKIGVISHLGLLNDATILEILESQQNNQSTLSYVIDFGDVINTVEIIINNSDSYNIKFIEGNKAGVMCKTSDDRIYLNDEEMNIETIDKENKSLTTGVLCHMQQKHGFKHVAHMSIPLAL